ncbi:MAG TPA: prepilin-type N-terminal cleavage/methylation domain-containing protein, partial [bacterium]|nr:prepilin-type N-terminal cleavage/methylation domain-containing protein [bacterium]
MKKNKNGIGLIEVIISVFIISILFVPLVNNLYSNLNLLIHTMDSKTASDIAMNIIESIKNSKEYTVNHQNFTYDYYKESSDFYDTYSIIIYQKDNNGDTLPGIVYGCV